MGGRGIIGRAAYAVALLAVALFSSASVRSAVMQVSMTAPALSVPMCGSMAGAHSASQDLAPGQKGHTTCAVCAAAGHAPICTAAVAVLPSLSVAWTAYAVLRPLVPRGPPSITPKSRGPPRPTLTV